MPTTPKGLVYPASSEHTRLWEHLQNLAESVESELGPVDVPVTLNAGFGTDPGGVEAPLRMTYHPLLDRVTLEGAVFRTGANTASISVHVLGTVPADYRPATGKRINGPGTTTVGSGLVDLCRILVYPDGSLSVQFQTSSVIPTGDWVSVTGTSYQLG